MKKSLLCMFILAMVAITPALAQEERPLRWRGFETNRFWDNWEIAAAGGGSFLQVANRSGVKDPGKFFDRVGWNANIAFTKWVVPVVGMRLQLDGGEYQNYSFDMPRYGEGIFKTPYVFVHGDVLVNMSNWIGGYRPDRVYSAISYVGFGYTAMSWTKKSAGSYNGEYAFTSGLLNKFRVGPRWDIELDLRSWIIPEKSLPVEIQSGGRYAFALSASLGVAYRFNNRDWTPAYSQLDVDGYIAAILALEERLLIADSNLVAAGKEVTALTSNNKELQAELERCKSSKPMVKSAPMPECVVFFVIGEAALTDYAKATLDTYADQIKRCDTTFTVTGYADKETGSAERNEQLSEMRAEAVKSYLVAAGVAPTRITTEWVGDTEMAFTSPDTPTVNRCVIIK